MTIINKESWVCHYCGQKGHYYDLLSTNNFWGNDDESVNYGPPSECPSCGSEEISDGKLVIVPVTPTSTTDD